MQSSGVNSTGPPTRVRYLNPSEFHEMLRAFHEDQYDLIDIRRIDEFAKGHIEGAKLLPLDSLGERYIEIDQERVTIIYCKSGRRCQRGVQILRDRGWHDICVLDGGYDAYRRYLVSLRG
jgi:rhodanese-related sulfurtransferase